MDGLVVYTKTAKGIAEIATRTAQLSMTARRVLIMSSESPPAARDPYAKLKGEAKTGKVFRKFDIKPVPPADVLRKPEWIRVKAGSPATRFYEIKSILREHRLHTVCEEASCPNIGECFGKGTATFMITLLATIAAI